MDPVPRSGAWSRSNTDSTSSDRRAVPSTTAAPEGAVGGTDIARSRSRWHIKFDARTSTRIACARSPRSASNGRDVKRLRDSVVQCQLGSDVLVRVSTEDQSLDEEESVTVA